MAFNNTLLKFTLKKINKTIKRKQATKVQLKASPEILGDARPNGGFHPGWKRIIFVEGEVLAKINRQKRREAGKKMTMNRRLIDIYWEK
jgi:hypothetical protein